MESPKPIQIVKSEKHKAMEKEQILNAMAEKDKKLGALKKKEAEKLRLQKLKEEQLAKKRAD